MEPKYFDSSNLLKINKIINDLYSDPSREFLIAPTRTGKTVGIKYAIKDRADSFYIEVRPAETGKGFWTRLLNSLYEQGRDEKPFRDKTLDYLVENSSKILVELRIYKLIVIDEVGNFKPQFIKFIRQLMDNAKREKCSVLLTSPGYALANMKKWEAKGIGGIAEFLSRIEYVNKLPKHTKNDIKNLFKIYEVYNPSLEKFIWEHAESLGDAARMLHNYLKGRDPDDRNSSSFTSF